MKKVLLVSLVYQEIDLNMTQMESLFPLIDLLDIIVLENYSSTTEEKGIPYFLNLLKEKKISQYILFEKNIGGSAFFMFFIDFLNNLKNYDYIVITDGDVQALNNNWLFESIMIIDKAENAFCCAVDYNTDNLPIESFPESRNWMPIPIDHGWYLESATGGHLLMFKSESINDFVVWLQENKLLFIDDNIRGFCHTILKKRWYKTKYSKCKHLVWDLYHDKTHPYTIMKMKPREEIFRTVTFCNYIKHKLINNEIISNKIVYREATSDK
jgi:hypothetical protein